MGTVLTDSELIVFNRKKPQSAENDIHVRFTMMHISKNQIFENAIGSCKFMQLVIFRK